MRSICSTCHSHQSLTHTPFGISFHFFFGSIAHNNKNWISHFFLVLLLLARRNFISIFELSLLLDFVAIGWNFKLLFSVKNNFLKNNFIKERKEKVFLCVHRGILPEKNKLKIYTRACCVGNKKIYIQNIKKRKQEGV